VTSSCWYNTTHIRAYRHMLHALTHRRTPSYACSQFTNTAQQYSQDICTAGTHLVLRQMAPVSPRLHPTALPINTARYTVQNTLWVCFVLLLQIAPVLPQHHSFTLPIRQRIRLSAT
jgi:hypothetical protein